MSNAIKIQGTLLNLQPSSHNWIPRNSLGIDGGGHPIYPSVREYELKWDLMSISEYDQLINFYNAVSSTGSVVVDLPRYNNSSYTFYSYTGCTLQEPEIGGFFEECVQDVTLLILKIRT